MIATRGTAGRLVFAIARQVSLSMLGTLATTAVMATLHAQWAEGPAAPAVAAISSAGAPILTSAGKFAARAVDGGTPDPFVTLIQLPAVLPMFTAPAVPRLEFGTADLPAAIDPKPGLAPASDPARSAARHVTRRATSLRHPEAEGVAMAPLPPSTPTPPEDPSLWSRWTKAYQTAVAWSGALVDSLLP